MMDVRDTLVTAQSMFQGLDGKAWKKLEIAWNDASFEPGQFLMAEPFLSHQSAPAPSALTIQNATENGFEVFVHPNSPLYALDKGDGVIVWGPSGRRAPVEGSYVLLCDDAGALLAAPLVKKLDNACKGAYLLGEGVDAVQTLGVPIIRIPALHALPDLSDADTLVVVLPLARMAEWKSAVSLEIAQKSIVFVGAKVGCGTGACRGCFIHSKEDPCGVPVCQCGPFLPVGDVDYTRDQNFLGHYV